VSWRREFSDYRSARQFEILLKKQKGGVGFLRLTEGGS